MESVNLDMEDIFETAADLDDDIAVPPPMPDLDDDDGPLNPNGSNGEEERGEDVLAKLKDISKGASKKKVMRPQPKLDVERLKSKRGLAVLPKMFKDVKFKGKGHEVDDLNVMMGKLEHWAHRLFPKVPFDDFIERLERLGGKKPVQTCVKRIRLDIPINDEDYVERGEDEGKDGSEAEDQNGETHDDVNGVDAEEAYEEMMRQERERMEKEKLAKEDKEHCTDQSNSQRCQSPPASQGRLSQIHGTKLTNESCTKNGSSSTPRGLTTEQQARIERNRQLAIERRMAKLAPTSTGTKPTVVGMTKSTLGTEQGSDVASSQPNKQSQKSHASITTDEDCTRKTDYQPDSAACQADDEGTVKKLEAMLSDNEGTSTANKVDSDEASLKLHLSSGFSPSSHNQTLTGRGEGKVTQGDLEVRIQTQNKQLNQELTVTESIPGPSAGSQDNTERLHLHLTETVEMDSEQNLTELCDGQGSGDMTRMNQKSSGSVAESEHEFKLKLSITDDEGGMETESE